MQQKTHLVRILVLAVAALAAPHAAAASDDELIPVDGSCWKQFAPRASNAPAGELRKREHGYALTLVSGGKRYGYGGWRCRIENIQPERHYRLRAQLAPAGFNDAEALRESVGVQIRWRGDFGDAVAPTYVWNVRQGSGGVYEFDRTVQAPPGTKAADLELVLQWTPAGKV